MRVLVTGGNRYIGLDLVFELARRGHAVTLVNSHVAPLPDGARRIHADRRIPGEFEKALAPLRDAFDAVFDNTAFVPSDLEPMIELFRGRVRHYVFTSSQAVYRRSFVQPMREDFRARRGRQRIRARRTAWARCGARILLERASGKHGFPATACASATRWVRAARSRPAIPLLRRLEAGRPILIPGEGFAA